MSEQTPQQTYIHLQELAPSPVGLSPVHLHFLGAVCRLPRPHSAKRAAAEIAQCLDARSQARSAARGRRGGSSITRTPSTSRSRSSARSACPEPLIGPRRVISGG